jgi:DNA-3-methyladenine glycosylase II
MPTLNTLQGTLTPRAPFDFAKTLHFVGDFTPTEGEQRVTTRAITKTITLNGRAVAFQVRDTGILDEPRVEYTLWSEQVLSEAEHRQLRERISFFLSLDDDLSAFYRVGQDDPHFAPIVEALYGLHQPKFLTPFEIACWAVLTQRSPITIAHRVKLALMKRWGTHITLGQETYYAFPEVQQLASVLPAELAEVVRNARKVEYLQAVIDFFSQADETYLRSGDYEAVAASIRAIRGIGEWSAFFILARGLGRTERTPVSGKEILNAASRIYGQEMTPADLQKIVERYGDQQGHWAFYLRASGLFTVAASPVLMGM